MLKIANLKKTVNQKTHIVESSDSQYNIQIVLESYISKFRCNTAQLVMSKKILLNTNKKPLQNLKSIESQAFGVRATQSHTYQEALPNGLSLVRQVGTILLIALRVKGPT